MYKRTYESDWHPGWTDDFQKFPPLRYMRSVWQRRRNVWRVIRRVYTCGFT